MALGRNASASAAQSVALGSNSIADRANTVSVGAAGSERQIVNVARGTAATDAVNVTQLQDVTALLGGGAKIKADGTVQAPSYAVTGATQPIQTVSAAVTALDASIQDRVAYDSPSHDKVTLGGATASAPVALTNVKAAALSDTSNDAVNGSQLNTTNKNGDLAAIVRRQHQQRRRHQVFPPELEACRFHCDGHRLRGNRRRGQCVGQQRRRARFELSGKSREYGLSRRGRRSER